VQLLIVGGGMGGVAAALAAARAGVRVVLSEEYAWIGGQVTSQGVPPDEHPWIETVGGTRSYRRYRDGVRDYYRRAYPLVEEAAARSDLNPGAGWVSKICHEPRASLAVLEEMLAPHISSGRICLLVRHVPTGCDSVDGTIRSVELTDLATKQRVTVAADYVIDATETGDLLRLADIEHVTGFESRAETGEPAAPSEAQPNNMQAVSICFALDHVAGSDNTIERPEQYDRWKSFEPSYWGAPLLSWTAPDPRTTTPSVRVFEPNPGDDVTAVVADQSRDAGDRNLWAFRRILARDNFASGFLESDITMVNWPNIDYFEAPLIDDDPGVVQERLHDARQLSLSMLYWMQTEAPRPDGGRGWPALRLRPDVMGTADGLAMAPYHRESRRIRALTTVTQRDVSAALRTDGKARTFADSVGIGMYRIDLHPSTGGDNYIDVPAAPFQIPLGALIPQREGNLLAGAKNIGTTHVTNGCYRLHPVEWNIGEAAGLLAAHCLAGSVSPTEVHRDARELASFQERLMSEGVELQWPDWVSAY
jgi:FAD dependent oxidoreductase